MKHLLRIAALFVGLIASTSAFAVCGTGAGGCFWVGGTGTWDLSATTHWASATGGAGGVAVPTSNSPITFDGASGGGTVTVNANVVGAVVTAGAFTGTIDFSANNNSPTFISFSFTGAGASRVLNCGSGTWTFSGTSGNIFDATTLTTATLSCASAAMTFAASSPGASRSFSSATSQSYGAITVSAGATTSSNNSFTFIGSTESFSSIVLSGPLAVIFPSNSTYTLANAPAWTGTSVSPIGISSSNIGSATPQVTFSITSGQPALNWVTLSSIKFTVGTSGTCTNCFDLSNNSGITINAPSGAAGGGHIIGG